MKKLNQAPTKKAKTAEKSAQQKPQQVRKVPLYTTEQLQRMTADPATVKVPRRPVSARQTRRLRIIALTPEQARKLGPGLPRLEAFLPIADDLQLARLLDAVPVQWSRNELGPKPGKVTLIALPNPTEREMPPAAADRLRALVWKEVRARKPMMARIRQVEFIYKNVSPSVWQICQRSLAKMAAAVRANPKQPK